MRIVGACSGKKTIQGTIQGNSKNNFGFFSMNTSDVKARCSGILDSVNANLSSKGIPGTIVFCKFDNHDGNRYFTVYVQVEPYSQLSRPSPLALDEQRENSRSILCKHFIVDWEKGRL